MSNQIAIASAVVLLGHACIIARADSIDIARSYTVYSADRQFVFVCIRSTSSEIDAYFNLSKESPQSKEIVAIRKKYKQTGLYRNDGSTSPLWSTEEECSFVCADGIHTISLQSIAAAWSDNELVLTFCKNGKPVKGYRLGDLIKDQSRLFTSSSGFQIWCENGYLQDQDRVLFITTSEGTNYRFDVRTGEMIAGPMRLYLVLAAILAALLIFLFCWNRRRPVDSERGIHESP